MDYAYIGQDFYPSAVRDNQAHELSIREAYVDIANGDWDYRLGRQQIVWGDMVGAFIADVVSARDLREFFLPELEAMRIAQWAARAEYFSGDFHAELLWVPVPSVDNIGKPGAEFYPFIVPSGTQILSQPDIPFSLDNMNYGARVTYLKNGWDMSAFYYRSVDVKTAFYPVNATTFQPRHDQIDQVGGTVSKDVGESMVARAEIVHTHGRNLALFSGDVLATPTVQPSDMLDYAVGLDYAEGNTRVNLELFAETILDFNSQMGGASTESYVGILVNHKLRENFDAEIQAFSGLNRSDYLIRPKVVWRFAPEWRAQSGVDVFGGVADGIFGRFDNRDRVYIDVRRDF